MTPAELFTVLHAKGVSVTVAGNRLRCSPWTLMTDDERAGFREHRQALKALVLTGATCRVLPPPPEATVEALPVEAPKPEMPEVPEHIRRVIDYNTPAEVERRRREATAEMYRMFGREGPFL